MIGKTKTAIILAMSMAMSGIAVAQDVGVTKDTIKIGLTGPMTGPVAAFGKIIFGVESVFKEVNDKGGINGRKIVIVREDHQCDPARGLAAFKKLATQDHIFALAGGTCSNVVMAMKPEVEKAGIPYVVTGAAATGISQPLAPNIFQTTATTDEVGRTMIDFAMSKPGTTKIAFVSHSDDWGKSNRDPAIAHLKSKYKLDPVQDLTMERGSTDATPQILRIRESGAQFVVLMMYPAELAIFVRDAYKYGLKIPMLAPQSITLEDTRDRVGNVAAVQNLAIFYPYGHTPDSPEMKKLETLIHKYYPSEKLESFSYLGMTGAYTLVKALQDAGPDLTRANLIAALNKIKNYDTGVASVPVSFSPQDHAGIKSGVMAKFKDGKIAIMKSWQDQ